MMIKFSVLIQVVEPLVSLATVDYNEGKLKSIYVIQGIAWARDVAQLATIPECSLATLFYRQHEITTTKLPF